MPTYRITIINRDFSACTDSDMVDFDEARRQAIKGALQIGTDEISAGKMFFGAEISIGEGDKVIERLMVSAGHTPLKI